MDERDMSGELRSVFLRESSLVLPGTVWRDAGAGTSMEYPQASPVLGTLTVEFGSDEIMVFVGPRGHHTHFEVDDSPTGTQAEQITEAAKLALFFVRDVVQDRMAVRWGVFVSGAHSVRRGTTGVGRVWKWLTPWVREAVWSGHP